MLVGSSGGAPSSCAAAHDTINRQQSNTPQEKVAFFTRTSSVRRICNPSDFVMCNQTANCAPQIAGKLLIKRQLFVNCLAPRPRLAAEIFLLRHYCKTLLQSAVRRWRVDCAWATRVGSPSPILSARCNACRPSGD